MSSITTIKFKIKKHKNKFSILKKIVLRNRFILVNYLDPLIQKSYNINSFQRDVRLLYGLRRRKHNSDSDTNESDTSEGDESANRSSRRFSPKKTSEEEGEIHEANMNSQKKKKKQQEKKKNIAKYIERENLSETELNVVSSSDDESYRIKSITKKHQQQQQKIEQTEAVNQQKISPPPPEKDIDESLGLEQQEKNRINLLTAQNSLNFKEFSTQLYSCLSLMKGGEQASDADSTGHHLEQQPDQQKEQRQESNDFIDNEIYKFILNGDVRAPPGFDVNSEEAKEIEELGKKLATFQIETDTEMSIFNSSNSSSSNNSDDLDEDEKKRVANFARL